MTRISSDIEMKYLHRLLDCVQPITDGKGQQQLIEATCRKISASTPLYRALWTGYNLRFNVMPKNYVFEGEPLLPTGVLLEGYIEISTNVVFHVLDAPGVRGVYEQRWQWIERWYKYKYKNKSFKTVRLAEDASMDDVRKLKKNELLFMFDPIAWYEWSDIHTNGIKAVCVFRSPTKRRVNEDEDEDDEVKEIPSPPTDDEVKEIPRPSKQLRQSRTDGQPWPPPPHPPTPMFDSAHELYVWLDDEYTRQKLDLILLKPSPTNVIFPTMNEQLLSQGRYFVDVLGDGNCLFRAVSRQLRGTEDYHQDYRQMAVKEMNDRKDLQIEGSMRDARNRTESVEQRVTRMAQLGEYGDNHEIAALVYALQRDFIIHQHMIPDTRIGEVGGEAIHLVYTGMQPGGWLHYGSAERRKYTPPIMGSAASDYLDKVTIRWDQRQIHISVVALAYYINRAMQWNYWSPTHLDIHIVPVAAAAVDEQETRLVFHLSIHTLSLVKQYKYIRKKYKALIEYNEGEFDHVSVLSTIGQVSPPDQCEVLFVVTYSIDNEKIKPTQWQDLRTEVFTEYCRDQDDTERALPYCMCEVSPDTQWRPHNPEVNTDIVLDVHTRQMLAVSDIKGGNRWPRLTVDDLDTYLPYVIRAPRWEEEGLQETMATTLHPYPVVVSEDAESRRRVVAQSKRADEEKWKAEQEVRTLEMQRQQKESEDSHRIQQEESARRLREDRESSARIQEQAQLSKAIQEERRLQAKRDREEEEQAKRDQEEKEEKEREKEQIH